MTDSNINTGNSAFQTTEPDMQPIYNSGIPLLPDPGFLWQVFRRNLLMFLIILCIVGGLTAALLKTLEPVYIARASILIEPTTDPIRTTAPGQNR